MDAELAVLEQRQAKTRALKQGMMQELLTGQDEAGMNTATTQLVKPSELSEIPKGAELNPDQLAAVLDRCAWAHSEWIPLCRLP